MRAVIALLAVLAACDIPDVTFEGPSGGPGNPDAPVSVTRQPITVTWSLLHVATDTQLNCPAATASARIRVTPYNPAILQVDNPNAIDFPVDCATRSATIQPPVGVYIATMVILNSSGTTIALSDLVFADSSQGPTAIELVFSDDGGFLALTWDLLDRAGGARVSCEAAGISSAGVIELISHNATDSYTDTYDCNDHVGTTQPMLPGTYTFELRGRQGGAIVTTNVVLPSKTITANTLTVVDDLKLPVH